MAGDPIYDNPFSLAGTVSASRTITVTTFIAMDYSFVRSPVTKYERQQAEIDPEVHIAPPVHVQVKIPLLNALARNNNDMKWIPRKQNFGAQRRDYKHLNAYI